MKLTSPFADAPSEQPPAEHRPAGTAETVAPPRPRRNLLEIAEGWMPGVGSARLPSVATVRAYHRAGEYVPGEAALIAWPARAHGWFAVCWTTTFTCIAWVGAGDYRRRFRTLWKVGLPGLVRAQLPPLKDLAGARLVWVACWSAVAWCGLKFWRPVMVLAYLLLAALPVLF